ncbi:hypothetical protein [Deinococcus phoenicis]|nr:hypothetical protein [Deinococcus phoenicis]
MNRFLLSLLATLTLGTGSAVSFGGLNVTPRGPQNLNLETGATDLPQGGTATDATTGLRLSADQMQLAPGERLSAQGATLTTRQGGTLHAQSVTYDLKLGTVTASGDVTYNDARLKNLSAGRVVLHVKTGFVTAQGRVKATAPALSAETLVFDTRTVQVLLSGDARLTLPVKGQQVVAGSRPLLLTFSGNRLLRATAGPDAAAVSRFAPYLR